MSINDRLGAFLFAMGIPDAGESFPPLRRQYLGELLAIAVTAAEDQEETLETIMHGSGDHE